MDSYKNWLNAFLEIRPLEELDEKGTYVPKPSSYKCWIGFVLLLITHFGYFIVLFKNTLKLNNIII